MTIPNENIENNYVGNGSATTFAYTFPIFEDTDIFATKALVNGTEIVLLLGNDYTVSGAGNSAGGNVILVSALLSGERLNITSRISKTQEYDIRSNATYRPDTMETALDRLTRMAQENERGLDRTVRVSDTDTASIVLPSSTARAGRYLGFDSLGNMQALQLYSGDAGLLTGIVAFLAAENTFTDSLHIESMDGALPTQESAFSVAIGNVVGQPRLASFKSNGALVHELLPPSSTAPTQNLCVYRFGFTYPSDIISSAAYHELYTDIKVASGVTNGGEHLASYIQHNRNISQYGDSGTLNSLKGFQISIGHDLIDGAATPVTNEVTAVYLRLKANTGTIGNMFGIRLAYQGPVPVSTHISGGLWGIFADDNRMKHAFYGKTAFGSSGTAAESVDVQAGNLKVVGTLGNTLMFGNIVPTGSQAMTLGSYGPTGVISSVPYGWIRINLNGTYNLIVPAWRHDG